MSRTAMLLRLVLVIALALLSGFRLAAAQETLTIFAAASLKNAIDDVNESFTAKTGVKVSVSYAASSALIKQIEQGAPADIFISADVAWMDYAAQKKLIKPETRFDLLGNRLVLIAAKSSKQDDVKIGPNFDLAKLAGDGRIATADVQAVPLGKYAKASLQKLGAWEKTEPKLAMAENARAALALVARSEAPLGIVYETDAKIEPDVKVIGVFPENTHPAITYPAALTLNAKAQGKAYLDYLRSATSQVTFEHYGFFYRVKAGP